MSLRNFPKVRLREHFQAYPDDPSKLLSFANTHGDFVNLGFRKPIFLVSNPDAIERVLKKNVDNYSKDFKEYNRLSHLLGKGLLINMEDSWLPRRRALQTIFNAQRLNTLDDYIIPLTNAMLTRWEWYEKHSQPLSLLPELLTLVLQISLRFLFQEDVSFQEGLKLIHHSAKAQYHMAHALSLHPWVPTIGNRAYYWHKNHLIKFLKKLLIKKRETLRESSDDFISLLLRFRDPNTNAPLSDDEIMAEMFTFMATGHETTGSGLAWIFYSFLQDANSMRLVSAEVNEILNDRTPTQADLSQLKFSKMVIQEGLRLYPPIWNFARHTKEEDELCGFSIPANSRIIICPFVLHRLTSSWKDPNQFIPERFTEENSRERSRMSYLPFGFGPHTCIANTFSLIKLQFIFAMIVQRYHMTLLPESYHVPLEPLISLRPKKPIRVKLRRRS